MNQFTPYQALFALLEAALRSMVFRTQTSSYGGLCRALSIEVTSDNSRPAARSRTSRW